MRPFVLNVSILPTISLFFQKWPPNFLGCYSSPLWPHFPIQVNLESNPHWLRLTDPKTNHLQIHRLNKYLPPNPIKTCLFSDPPFLFTSTRPQPLKKAHHPPSFPASGHSLRNFWQYEKRLAYCKHTLDSQHHHLLPHLRASNRVLCFWVTDCQCHAKDSDQPTEDEPDQTTQAKKIQIPEESKTNSSRRRIIFTSNWTIYSQENVHPMIWWWWHCLLDDDDEQTFSHFFLFAAVDVIFSVLMLSLCSCTSRPYLLLQTAGRLVVGPQNFWHVFIASSLFPNYINTPPRHLCAQFNVQWNKTEFHPSILFFLPQSRRRHHNIPTAPQWLGTSQG